MPHDVSLISTIAVGLGLAVAMGAGLSLGWGWSAKMRSVARWLRAPVMGA